MHLIGFNEGIYHDARSPERQITACISPPSFNPDWFVHEGNCNLQIHHSAILGRSYMKQSLSVMFTIVQYRCVPSRYNCVASLHPLLSLLQVRR